MSGAEDEIGIGASHEGIIVLPEDAKAGTPAAEYYKVESDAILEVDITPNRVDAASHYGVARDLAAFLQVQGISSTLHLPPVEAFKIDDKSPAVKVEVIDNAGCTRYSGITLKGVKVGASPV
ncbi:phenylalanyl-tRNA synthetase beta chain [Candidatus Symbiothrix dinenymphae]|nr:phenylalanyl-tRNA synthetase beta chain [Candidatus Symbiothrix dinenymphae]